MTTSQHMEQLVKMLCTSAVTVATAAWSMTAHIDATIHEEVRTAVDTLSAHQGAALYIEHIGQQRTRQQLDTLTATVRRYHHF